MTEDLTSLDHICTPRAAAAIAEMVL